LEQSVLSVLELQFFYSPAASRHTQNKSVFAFNGTTAPVRHSRRHKSFFIPHRSKDCGSWYNLRLLRRLLMLVVSSTSNKVMKITLEPEIDQQPTRSDTESKSNLINTNFSEARHQLMFERRQSVVSPRMTQAIPNKSARQQPFTGSSNVAEETLYFFISAPALVYTIYTIFHL
jgi:hypothetical protein